MMTTKVSVLRVVSHKPVLQCACGIVDCHGGLVESWLMRLKLYLPHIPHGRTWCAFYDMIHGSRIAQITHYTHSDGLANLESSGLLVLLVQCFRRQIRQMISGMGPWSMQHNREGWRQSELAEKQPYNLLKSQIRPSFNKKYRHIIGSNTCYAFGSFCYVEIYVVHHINPMSKRYQMQPGHLWLRLVDMPVALSMASFQTISTWVVCSELYHSIVINCMHGMAHLLNCQLSTLFWILLNDNARLTGAILLLSIVVRTIHCVPRLCCR